MTPRPESRPGDDRRRRARRRAERADGEAQADPPAGRGHGHRPGDRGPSRGGGRDDRRGGPAGGLRRGGGPGRRGHAGRGGRRRRGFGDGRHAGLGGAGARPAPPGSHTLDRPARARRQPGDHGASWSVGSSPVRRPSRLRSSSRGIGGVGGHPVALPWDLAAEIRDLPEGTGVNALLAARADRVLMLDVDDPGTTADLDTPDDYRAWVEAGREDPGRPNR